MYISRSSVHYLCIVLNQSKTCWDRCRFHSYCGRSSFEFGIGYFFFFNFTGFALILYFFSPNFWCCSDFERWWYYHTMYNSSFGSDFFVLILIEFLVHIRSCMLFFADFLAPKLYSAGCMNLFLQREFKKKKKWRIKINVSLFCISIVFHNHISLFKV